MSLSPAPRCLENGQLRQSADIIANRIASFDDLCPDSVALSKHGCTLTFGELNRRADQFANYLAECRGESGGIVAICMERSVEWIITALGIMRAGAAYVPLEPSWPDSRLSYAVKDSGASALVCRGDLADRLRVGINSVDPWCDAAAIAASPVSICKAITPDSLAYVIYTSGSTGFPKGVEITHANLANVVRWHREACSVNSQDRVSHLLGLGFDAAALEIWAHLCAGATLCLPDEMERSSPELIQAWLIRERVTISLAPAILGARLMTLEWPPDSALRTLIVGGDVLHQAPPASLPFRVINHYGPTECTVVTTWATLTPGSDELPPIGHPIDGAKVYLLGDQGLQVPDGTVGEIYIGGSGVGRGYRNLPALTEQSFLPDPFAGVTDAIMYRTGDLGRRRADGQLEFHGRQDRQVKIRGQRVELDEVGSVLLRHPDVSFAVAVERSSDAGEKQLTAYVLFNDRHPVPTTRELQEYLLRSLPDYMIPSAFARLRFLPLSANGKLDLTMLASHGDLLPPERTQEAPATPIEEKLLAMMQEVLGNNAIGGNDNFFLIGGHSLLGMQLVMRIRQSFGTDLTLQQLFEAPTVKRLARTVEQMIIESINALTDDEARAHLTE